MQNPVYIVVAVDENNGIGKDGKLAWRFKNELQYFAKTTKTTEDPDKENIVIMGRTTWESIQDKFRPLPGRRNIILTRQKDYEANGAEVSHSLDEALNLANDKTEKIFIIGGAQVFTESINSPALTGLYLTLIHKIFDCDTFFPKIPKRLAKKKLAEDKEDAIGFEYFLYE